MKTEIGLKDYIKNNSGKLLNRQKRLWKRIWSRQCSNKEYG